MLLAILFALIIGAVGYVLCRGLFQIWPPLPLIALYTTFFMLGRNYMPFYEIIFLLPVLAFAMAGAYFFSTSMPGKWNYLEFKWFLCFCILVPLEWACYLVGVYNIHLIPGAPEPNSNADTLYVLMLFLSPNVAAFLLWLKMRSADSLPEQ